VVDLELATDAARAAKSDALRDALDYDAIARAVTAFAGSAKLQLIETTGRAARRAVAADFGIAWLRLELPQAGRRGRAQTSAS